MYALVFSFKLVTLSLQAYHPFILSMTAEISHSRLSQQYGAKLPFKQMRPSRITVIAYSSNENPVTAAKMAQLLPQPTSGCKGAAQVVAPGFAGEQTLLGMSLAAPATCKTLPWASALPHSAGKPCQPFDKMQDSELALALQEEEWAVDPYSSTVHACEDSPGLVS